MPMGSVSPATLEKLIKKNSRKTKLQNRINASRRSSKNLSTNKKSD